MTCGAIDPTVLYRQKIEIGIWFHDLDTAGIPMYEHSLKGTWPSCCGRNILVGNRA
jgi:hypothetical protein